MAARRRSLIIAPAIVFLCSILGGMFGPTIMGASAATSEDELKQSLRAFTKVLGAVEENFADKVSPDKTIYKGAIPGMTRTLDPHTSFFDPKDFQLLREDQKGHYYGVGMTVAPRNGKTIVIAPFMGSPAYKAGIRPGDVILEVNDKKTDNMTTTEVAELLKGPRGSQVQVIIAREGADKPVVFNIVRDEIPRKSVEDAFWIRPGIMYLDIQSFNENTSREV
ncbi:MAG TPA: PDZ domain-containing protein, partial [Bryobacteraceae bacterium]|nr:PDZ domain-containing protein [Bryobacteraceae bacterium]